MGEVRIVKLGPVHNGTEAVTFEDAFGAGVGGYSYADGEGRAKRKKRKLERIENRREVQGARREARAERIADRTELQTARKSKRLTKREMGTESRLARRTGRAENRAHRRELKHPQPAGLDQTVPQEMNDGAPTTAPAPGTNSNIDPGLPVQSNDGYDQGGQDQGYNEGGISGNQTGQGNYYGDETQYQGPEYGAENDSQDIPSADPELDDAYEQGYIDAQEDFDNEEVSVDNFDGVMGAEDRYNEMQDKNDISVNPAVQDLADKCIWNEKLIEALKMQRKNATGNPQEISKTILVRAKRLKDLNNELIDYANCCGNYSNADGSPETVNSRKREVMMARKRAHMKAIKKHNHPHGGDTTPVNAELNPIIEKNRIVVPAESTSNANGTGINGLDNIDDYDAPTIREFYLGADGSFTKGIDLGSIAVGVLLAVGFIALNKQYKWIKL